MRVATDFCSSVFCVIQPSIQQLFYKESVVRTQHKSSSLLKAVTQMRVLPRLQGTANQWFSQNFMSTWLPGFSAVVTRVTVVIRVWAVITRVGMAMPLGLTK